MTITRALRPGLRVRPGAHLVASRDEAGVIARERPSPPPQLADDGAIACFGHGEPFRRDAAARLAELAR
jgi:hypothetical protein